METDKTPPRIQLTLAGKKDNKQKHGTSKHMSLGETPTETGVESDRVLSSGPWSGDLFDVEIFQGTSSGSAVGLL